MDALFLKEIQTDFYNESLSLIETFENVLLSNETLTADHVSELFRIAHSIKGGAAAVELKDVSVFTHKFEDFLSKFRTNPNAITADVVTLLLGFSDLIKNKFIAGLDEKDYAWNPEILLQQIHQFESGQTLTTTAPAVSTAPEEAASVTPVAPVAIKPTTPASTNPSTNAETTAAKTAKSKKSASQQVKVDVERLDAIFETIGELVIFKNQFKEQLSGKLSPEDVELTEKMDFIVKDLYDRTLGLRMTSLQPLFQRMQRILRDLSMQLKKDVQIKINGEDTEIDRNLFEQLPDPLIHLVRNAIDHGIENTEQRALTNKPAQATIELSAYYQSGQVIIEIQDDGKGINTETIFNKAKSKNLIPENSLMTDYTNEQIYNFLFLPGFSTAAQVSDLSGRGVGLDVVKTTIEKFQGKMTISSNYGYGTCFKCSLPLTTSLIDGITFGAGNTKYIVPNSAIMGIDKISRDQITTSVDNNDYVSSYATPILAININKYFKKENAVNTGKDVICLRSIINEQPVCFLFDEIETQCQVVVKPLPQLGQIKDFIGAAVSNDGSPHLILDLVAIKQNHLANPNAA